MPVANFVRCKKTFLLASATVGLFTLAITSSPASAATREQQTAACKGDALKLCTFSIPNEKKIAACLESKRDQLSPACKAMFPEKGTKKKNSKKKSDAS